MAMNLPPTPYKDPIVKPNTGKMTRGFGNWLLPFITRIQSAAAAVLSIALTGQAASIPTTSLYPVPSAGRYRVTVHARVTTAAAVNSSLIPTISYTDDGVACTQSGDALIANATNAPKSWSFLVTADASTPISYATTYVSVGAPAMAYALDITLESVS